MFRNSNIKTKILNRRGTGWKIKCIDPEYLNLPRNLTLNLNELYDSGRPLADEALENLTRLNGIINFTLKENTRLRLYALLKYVLGMGTHHDATKRPFGNCAPLMNPRPSKHSSSNITNLMEKIKKGSQKLRKAIEKDQDFINTASMNRWKKTLQDDNLDQETIRNCFKMTHWKEFTAKERDSILKLLTRKTLFNNQHRKVFQNSVRPDWAKEDFCWECKQETGEDVEEDLLHSLWTCQAKSDIINIIFNNLMIAPVLHPSTTHLMWGKFLVPALAHAHSVNSCVSRLGNFINWIITLDFFKRRNKERVNIAAITNGIRAKITWLTTVSIRSEVVLAASEIPAFGQATRPPEDNG